MKIKKSFVFLAIMALVIIPMFVFAISPELNPIGSLDAQGDPVTEVQIDTTDEIANLFIKFVNWFAWFIALASVVMGLYAGFLFITARGEPAELKTARATLLWAIIGIAVAILSFSIIAITKALLL